MSDELQEALTAAGVGALIQKVIDPMLLEYVRRYSPLLAAIPSQKWSSDQFYWNTRTALVPGGAVVDGGARPVGTSTYVQNSVQMKHFQAVGGVTGYAQEVTRQQIGDLRRREIEGAVQSLMWDLETSVVHGSAGATANGPFPLFDGLGAYFNVGTGVTQNMIDAQGAGIDLGLLDQVVDMVESNAAQPVFDDRWMFVMSPTANSRIAQLLTNQQRFVDKVTVAPGLLVPSYRDIPIVKSSFLASRGLQMSTTTTAVSTASGTKAAGAYRYKVSAVVARYGELLPCPEVTATLTGAGNVTLAFTPPTGPDGGVPLYYAVWCSAAGGAANSETLLGLVDANVGVLADGITPVVTTSIIDTGSALIPQNGATQPANLPAAYIGTNANLAPKSGDDVYFMARDDNFIRRPFVREITPLEVYPTTASPDTLPFAIQTDTVLAVRAPKYGGRLRNVVPTLSS